HEISRSNARERLRNFRYFTGRLARRVGRVARSPLFSGLPISPRISKQTEQAAPVVQKVYPGCIGTSALIAGCGHHNWSSRVKSRDPEEVAFKVSQRDRSTTLGMTLIRRRTSQSIVNCGANPLLRRAFGLNYIKIFRVQFAQHAKKIRRGFA